MKENGSFQRDDRLVVTEARSVLLTAESVELHHEARAALTDRLDDDEESEQRCYVTPADGNLITTVYGDLTRIGVERQRNYGSYACVLT